VSPLNVVLMIKLAPENLAQISALSSRIEVRDATPFLNRPFSPRPFKDESAEASVNQMLKDAEIIFGVPHVADILTRAPGLKWIQLFSAGAEYILTPEMLKSPVMITNTSGIHVAPISETVFAFILAFAKQTPRLLQNQAARKWESFVPASLEGRTLGIIGYGSIGQGVARLARAFGMKVVAMRRSGRRAAVRNVERLYARSELPQLLSASDYIVVAVPSTPETRGLIGEKEFQMMKPGAFLVNIARGNILDEAALVRALEEKRLAGAGLDTFVKEPLPVNSPLWSLPNVFVTPHLSGLQSEQAAKAFEIFRRNLERYLAGRRLINLVDKVKGY
jgi:phosphoglycerate dehydrogenase-like enzyme